MSKTEFDINQTISGSVAQIRVIDTVAVSLLSPDAGSQPAMEITSDERAGNVIAWGPNNDWPTKARLKLEKSTTAFPLVKKLCNILYGRGLVYWKETTDANGNKTLDFTSIAEVDKFLEENNIEYFMVERMMDLFVSGNPFCEFILNKGGANKITNVFHLEAEFCRFTQPEEGKEINEIQYAAGWPTPKGTPEKMLFIGKRKQNKTDILKLAASKKKFAIQSYWPSPGRTVYAMPPHGALFRDDGWLDFGNSVPEIMNAINKNAWNIKYHIQIPHDYWQTINKNFDGLDKKKQDEFIDAQIKAMTDWLSGTTNTGKTFVSHFMRDFNGKEVAGFKIEAIDDKSKKDAYLTSVQESDQQVARAYGVDSSLSNIQPQGGKMGAGSGSDKRVGFENQVNTSNIDMKIVTEPLYIVKNVNGWPTELKFGFIHDIPTSLNENKEGVKTEM